MQAAIQNLGLLMYLSEDNTAGVGSSTLIAEILANTTYTLPIGGPGESNCVETQKLWVSGTARILFCRAVDDLAWS